MTILEYPPIAVSDSLKEWKIAITSVEQGYKSTTDRQDYRMGLEIIYKRRGAFMDIEKVKDNYNKDRKPRCFNYNIYDVMQENTFS